MIIAIVFFAMLIAAAGAFVVFGLLNAWTDKLRREPERDTEDEPQ